MDFMKKTLTILTVLSLVLIFACTKKEEPAVEKEDAVAE